MNLQLTLLAPPFAICRLSAGAPIPAWAQEGVFSSVSRTTDELSIVCEERLIPADIPCERQRRAFKVQGPLPFSMTGVLASISMPLADAKISIFAISTYDTDYILVNNNDLEVAVRALEESGYVILRHTE